jgi:hypothetical protein
MDGKGTLSARGGPNTRCQGFVCGGLLFVGPHCRTCLLLPFRRREFVSSRFLENSCTHALDVFKIRVLIATYEAVFLGKKNSVSEIGRIVL